MQAPTQNWDESSKKGDESYPGTSAENKNNRGRNRRGRGPRRKDGQPPQDGAEGQMNTNCTEFVPTGGDQSKNLDHQHQGRGGRGSRGHDQNRPQTAGAANTYGRGERPGTRGRDGLPVGFKPEDRPHTANMTESIGSQLPQRGGRGGRGGHGNRGGQRGGQRDGGQGRANGQD